MVRDRRLGRGLEDFSHLFLSPAATNAETGFRNDVPAPPPVICIAADGKVRERGSLTLNLALAFARRGKRVLLLDADFSHPRLWMRTSGTAHGSILGVIAGSGNEPPTAECADGIRLVTIDVDVSGLDDLDPTKRASLARWFTTAEEEADIVLAIVSPALSSHARAVIRASRDVVVVTPWRRNDMVDAYGLIKTVLQVNGDTRIGIISSGIDDPDLSEEAVGKMQRIVGQFLGKPLHNHGYIPSDSQRYSPTAKRKPLRLSTLSRQTIGCVAEISQSILQMNGVTTTDHPVPGNGRSLAERLFRTAVPASAMSRLTVPQ